MIIKTMTGSATDLTIGQNVLITGMTNTDNSVTAATIQINPMFRMRSGNNGNPAQSQ